MKSLTPRAALAALALLGLSCAASAADRAWINGRWFDGEKFVARTVYTIGGRLSTQAPSATLPVEDLQGRYVVPPYGDAHHHGIDGPEGLDAKIATFLRQGIFYVKNPNVIPDYLDASVRDRLNRPNSIDVSFSNGGLTGSGGHPGPLHDKLAARGVFKGMTPADMENRAYFVIDSAQQLAEKWPLIARGKPDFIKTYLNGDHGAGASVGAPPPWWSGGAAPGRVAGRREHRAPAWPAREHPCGHRRRLRRGGTRGCGRGEPHAAGQPSARRFGRGNVHLVGRRGRRRKEAGVRGGHCQRPSSFPWRALGCPGTCARECRTARQPAAAAPCRRARRHRQRWH